MDAEQLIFKPGLMQGQRILITGGGSGLGLEMGTAFLSLGAELYICGRRLGVLEEAAAGLMNAHDGRVVALACDVRQPDRVSETISRIWDDGGPLTGLVNNAAGNFVSRTEDISARGFDAVSCIVFRGSFLVTLECGKRWLAAGGNFSNLSSWSGEDWLRARKGIAERDSSDKVHRAV